MEIECPKCDELQELDHDDLPDNACDDAEYECAHCEHEFVIGWTAEAEIRDGKIRGNTIN